MFSALRGDVHSDVDEHVRRWVDAGILSEQQAEAIRRLESRTDTSEPTPRLSLVSEVSVYLGSLLALMGGAFIVGQAWEDLALAGRLSIGLAVAALGFVAGALLIRLDDAGARRLASFMWAVGTGGVAIGVTVVLDRWSFEEEAWNFVVLGVPIATIGIGLWRNLDRPLQMLTAVLGVALVVGGIGALVELSPWVGGLAVWATSVAAGSQALAGRLRPEVYVLAAASIAAIISASALGELNTHLGPAFAAITAAGVVAIGLMQHRNSILVIGVLGFLQSLTAVLATTFSGPVGAMGVAVVGLVLVVVVLQRSIHGGDGSGSIPAT